MTRLAPLLLATVLVGLAAPAVVAQPATGAISGRVLDAETHRPVSAATVQLAESGRGTAADLDGHYRIERVPAGDLEKVRSQEIEPAAPRP